MLPLLLTVIPWRHAAAQQAAQQAATQQAATQQAATPRTAPEPPARRRPLADAPMWSDTARTVWEVVPFVGGARHSPTGRWGATPDRDHLMLGVQFATPVVRAGAVTLLYAPNVVPLFVLTNNPRYGSRYRTVVVQPAGGGPAERVRVRVEDGRGPVYGFALAPLGIRLDARVARRTALFGSLAVGGVAFSQTVPVDGARRLNATFEAGGGFATHTRSGHALLLGYKYHHLSNIYTAPRNPGVDGNVVYLGLGWRLGAPR